MATSTAAFGGGVWLIEETDPGAVFTPERLTEEHRLIGRTADEFVAGEVLPALERLERRDWALARSLVRRCGELGFLGVDVPEALGGVELDRASAVTVVEAIGRCPSFATTFGAQTGLAITPLLCFGTEEQRRKYVPRLVTGELIGAYALSESGSGSDALGARARAVRQPDGSFALSGEKMWITNGGFADLIIVFAKVSDVGEGDGFTAFIVERGFAGVGSGKEEEKMGLHGSSTTPIILQDARVPAENVLGEIGKGHKVAFNVLNHGRYKLAAMCSGGARHVLAEAAAYALERRQFGQPIATFGAVRHKLAEMAIRMYAVESMLYRTAGLLESMPGRSHEGPASLAALEEFAVEASILKVAGSDMIDFVVDENVQIHGGNGFVHDYPAERHYRDARVNRIFEGTNEILRLFIALNGIQGPAERLKEIGSALRRPVRNLGLISGFAASRLRSALGATPTLDVALDERLAHHKRFFEKHVAELRTVTERVIQHYRAEIVERQQELERLADMAVELFATGCVLARTQRLIEERGVALAEHEIELCDLFVVESGRRFRASRESVQSAQDELRRNVASTVRASGGYFVADPILEAGTPVEIADEETKSPRA
jgi:alkylation response protein AidB-like acyl-CoA dehydrogenase